MTLLIAHRDAGVAEEIAFGARMCWRDARMVLASSGAEALACFARERLDLAILDAFATTPDGFDVCRHIRSQSAIPILMLCSHQTTMEVVRALDLGADDVVTWPRDILEVLARLRALLRRAGVCAATTYTPARSSGLWLDPMRREARLDGWHIRLTSTEYRLLETLISHAGVPVTHRRLLESVWGAACVNDVQYLKVFIQRLRRKLGDTAAAACIHTEWGIGYSFIPPDAVPTIGPVTEITAMTEITAFTGSQPTQGSSVENRLDA